MRLSRRERAPSPLCPHPFKEYKTDLLLNRLMEKAAAVPESQNP